MPKPACFPQYRLPPKLWMNILRRMELKLELHIRKRDQGWRQATSALFFFPRVSGYVDVCSLGSLRRKRGYLHLGGRGCSGHGAEFLRGPLMGLVLVPVGAGISAGTNHDRWLCWKDNFQEGWVFRGYLDQCSHFFGAGVCNSFAEM